MKNGKAIGNDGISNEMIKCFVQTRFVDVVRDLFNAILAKTYFPKLWKINYISPIFKSDDAFDPNNSRGIAVNSCFGKLFTLVINETLVELLDLRNILSYFQIGLRWRYRTSDHVFILNTILNSYFHKGKRVYACFVYFSKAYDSVWRDGILYKQILNGLNFKFVSLISSMYDDLQMTVKLLNGITPFSSSLVGVRQGRNLSPLLFDKFVFDIFEIFYGKECCPVNLYNKPISCLMYADDLLILYETEDGFTECLQRLNRYSHSHKWKMTINTKETKIIIFNKSGRMIRLKIRIGELTIESCFQYTYLGTVFTPNNNFKKAQSELYKKACQHSLVILRK